MSPVLILSRLCLNRRFQFLGISETSSRSTSRTLFTVSSSITRRRPARAPFSVGGARRQQLVETAERGDDLGGDQLRQPRDAAQHAVAARGDRVVERVQLAVVAEHLGEAAEVEQVLVAQAAELLERRREALV